MNTYFNGIFLPMTEKPQYTVGNINKVDKPRNCENIIRCSEHTK